MGSAFMSSPEDGENESQRQKHWLENAACGVRCRAGLSLTWADLKSASFVGDFSLEDRVGWGGEDWSRVSMADEGYGSSRDWMSVSVNSMHGNRVNASTILCVHIWMCMWWPEADIRCLPQSLSTLVF